MRAEEKLTEPVYRVATETTAPNRQPPLKPPLARRLPQRPPTNAVGFHAKKTRSIRSRPCFAPEDQPGELDRNIRDYSCTFVKRERVDGELGEYQYIC